MLLRPVTYIQNVIDPTFMTVLPTPPFPEYTSAHSTQSAAAAASLEYLLGNHVGIGTATGEVFSQVRALTPRPAASEVVLDRRFQPPGQQRPGQEDVGSRTR